MGLIAAAVGLIGLLVDERRWWQIAAMAVVLASLYVARAVAPVDPLAALLAFPVLGLLASCGVVWLEEAQEKGYRQRKRLKEEEEQRRRRLEREGTDPAEDVRQGPGQLAVGGSLAGCGKTRWRSSVVPGPLAQSPQRSRVRGRETGGGQR